MPKHTKDWLVKTKKEAHDLTLAARSALVREAFDAVALVGFLIFREEERALGLRVTEVDRVAYTKEFEKHAWPDFQTMAAKSTDDRIQSVLRYWQERANALGLEEWQKEQRSGGRDI